MRPRCASLALLAALLGGCGGGGGDRAGEHSFVGSDAGVVLYVTWNRDGDKLTGAVTQGVLDQDKRTVETSRASFTGEISGSEVTLDPQQSFGGNSTLTGTLDGDALELEYLRAGEGVVKVKLEQAGAGSFNAALATLRDGVEQTKAEEASQAAETTERQRVSEHAQAVQDDVEALELAAAGAPGRKGSSSYQADLAQLRRDLQTLRGHAQATLRANGLSVCSNAATVQSDLATLERHVATLHGRQSTRDTGAITVNEAIDKLREDFLTLQSDERRYLPPDAPTQRTVGRAVQRARRKLRKAGPSSSAVTRVVNAILEQARGLDMRSSIRCHAGGA